MRDAVRRLHDNITRVFMGHPEAVDRVVACLLARGHLLIEDVPGVGKTVLAHAIARSVECDFTRIQLTPDLLPSDVLGVSVYDRDTGEFKLKRGPIFANIVLADEINRTTPRTQSALLEAMSEASVSIDGTVIPLDPPFMLIATQNPAEFEGTYPLPENQLDRFLMRTTIGYPGPEDELRVLRERPGLRALPDLEPVLHRDDLITLQSAVDDVRTDDAILAYIVRFAAATREAPELRLGLSPRGSLALAQAARATAFLSGRDYVVPEDVTSNVAAVCAHRVIPAGGGHEFGTPGAAAAAERLLAEILDTVESPA
ncbi:MAG: AAA family ATPase [Phycisphaerales bacterium]|nr:MAG: AAA family ATPase [Phycisphaerales bacterium]